MSFFKSESGAVTVDWVVLTAGVVGLGLASAASVRGGVGSLGSDIDSSLSGAEVASMTLNAESLLRDFWELRNAQREALGNATVTWEQHQLDHLNETDEGFAARLQRYRDAEPGFDAYQAAIDAYVASGYQQDALVDVFLARGLDQSYAESSAQLYHDSYGGEASAQHEQALVDKWRARLAYYEYEAVERGLE